MKPITRKLVGAVASFALVASLAPAGALAYAADELAGGSADAEVVAAPVEATGGALELAPVGAAGENEPDVLVSAAADGDVLENGVVSETPLEDDVFAAADNAAEESEDGALELEPETEALTDDTADADVDAMEVAAERAAGEDETTEQAPEAALEVDDATGAVAPARKAAAVRTIAADDTVTLLAQSADARVWYDTQLEVLDHPESTIEVTSKSFTLKVKVTSPDGATRSDVEVWASVTTGNSQRYAYGVTDDTGVATVQFTNLTEGSNSAHIYTNATADFVGGVQRNYYGADLYRTIVVTTPSAPSPSTGNTSTAAAPTKVQILSLEQTGAPDGDRITATLQFTDDDGNVPAGIAYHYRYALYANTTLKSSAFITDSDGVTSVEMRNISGSTSGTKYDVYAQLRDEDANVLAVSEHIAITAVKPSIAKTDVSSTPSIEGKATGTITVAGSYPALSYYKNPNGATKTVDGTTITGLEAGTYYVFVPYYNNGNTYYIKSGNQKIEVEEIEAQRFNVTLVQDGTYWWQDNSQFMSTETLKVVEGESLELSVIANSDYVSDYVLDGITVEPAGNATVEVNKTNPDRWYVTVSDITGDVTLTARAVYAPKVVKYVVTARSDEGVNWSKSGVELSEGQSTSIYAKPASDAYYIEDVTAQPEGNATVSFNKATGEVFIKDISGDIELVAKVVDRHAPASIEVAAVDMQPQSTPDASAVDAVATLEYRVLVLDADGNPVPQTSVVASATGPNDVRQNTTRKTDEQGIATFTVRAFVGESTLTFMVNGSDPAVSVTRGLTVEQPDALYPDKSEDNVRYADATYVKGVSEPGATDGGYTHLPAHVEYFTYPVRRGEYDAPVFVYGTDGGTWVPVSGDAITGLGSGSWAFRFEQWFEADDATDHDTAHLFSHWNMFVVPIARWTVTADQANSTNVTWHETSLAATQGGSVTFYFDVPQGYVLDPSSLVVSGGSQTNPGYTDVAVQIDSDDPDVDPQAAALAGPTHWFAAVDGITRNLTLSVNAVEAAVEESEETDDVAGEDDAATEKDAPEEAPASDETPALEVTPASGEAPAIEETSASEAAPALEEVPAAVVAEAEPEQREAENPATPESSQPRASYVLPAQEPAATPADAAPAAAVPAIENAPEVASAANDIANLPNGTVSNGPADQAAAEASLNSVSASEAEAIAEEAVPLAAPDGAERGSGIGFLVPLLGLATAAALIFFLLLRKRKKDDEQEQ